MGENKGKKQFQKLSHSGNRKSHEPTAMELAFLKAQVRKGEDPSTVKNKEAQSALPTRPVTTTQAPPSVSKSQLNTPSPNTGKAKPVTPISATNAIKKVPTFKQSSGKSAPQRFEPSYPKKTEPVKLGLERVADKTLTLSSEFQQDTTPSSSRRNRVEAQTAEGKTQVHRGSYKDEIDIVMGLDFGTSSSKVIIRDSGRRTAYAFPCPLSSTGNAYLIPTQLHIGNDGKLSFSTGDHACGNIKSRLMVDPDNAVFSEIKGAQFVTVTDIAAGYMAQVIRFARAWFLKQTEAIYKKTHIHWHINIGIPSRNYDDVKMRKLFRVIAMAAWRVSLLPLQATVMDVKEYLQEARHYVDVNDDGPSTIPEEVRPLWLHPDYVNAHPEVIMEVVGYVRSPMRRDGLYLIVDVGATTLDAATFIIYNREGEDIFPILETAVERLGTMMLHRNRVEAVKAAMEKSLQKIAAIDPILPLPDLKHYAIGGLNVEMSDKDESFFGECCKMIGRTIKDTKDHRHPNSSVWKSELPVFICGGGGRLSSYQQMIKKMGLRCAEAWGDFKGFVIKQIPKPDELQAPDLPAKEYDRLAVAYGLSFTADEIGEVIKQSEISDIKRQDTVSDIEGRFVSKDMC